MSSSGWLGRPRGRAIGRGGRGRGRPTRRYPLGEGDRGWIAGAGERRLRTFTSVGIVSFSFCRPSLGPTSTILTLAGSGRPWNAGCTAACAGRTTWHETQASVRGVLYLRAAKRPCMR
jgi:hypothetical protein